MPRHYEPVKVVFKLDGQTVYSRTYPYTTEDLPRQGDCVRLPGSRARRQVKDVVYVYGKWHLLRIEINLTKLGRRRRR